jgi:hypothetical protein
VNVLLEGSGAPAFEAKTLAGETPNSAEALARGPLLLCFAMPEIHASRLAVGYLRRLQERLPGLAVWLVLQGEAAAVRAYAEGYLGGLTVIHDEGLELSRLYAVTHVPAVYYLENTESGEAQIRLAFTGFSRPALNRLAGLAAAATGAKAQELIGPSDNKGEYELAERALSAPRTEPG